MRIRKEVTFLLLLAWIFLFVYIAKNINKPSVLRIRFGTRQYNHSMGTNNFNLALKKHQAHTTFNPQKRLINLATDKLTTDNPLPTTINQRHPLCLNGKRLH